VIRYHTDHYLSNKRLEKAREALSTIRLETSVKFQFDEFIEAAEIRKHLDEALKDLSFRERMVIKLRFGLDGHPPLTLEKIGHKLNVTREYIRSLEESGLARLRHPCRAKKLEHLMG